ncbi:aldose-1-epimerase [Actinomycetaceae bacterium MB13-C1-2]|nr:aldose-1-epimerase [Actinomycetaceae bacterium MB13-C1-2]
MSTHKIRAGEYEAVVVNEGAGLAALSHDGRDLILSYDLAERPAGFNGKVLVPWPNRIKGAVYTFEGCEYTVPMTEPDRECALHGLKCWEEWDTVATTDHSVTLRTVTEPTDGYPFRLETTVTYELSADSGISIEVTTINTGDVPAPYGTGTHAYLTCDGALADECVLTLPAAEVLTVDQNLIPVGHTSVQSEGLDFREGDLIGTRQVDHAFTSLPSGEWSVTLSHPATGMTVVLSSDEDWLQVFSGDNQGRRGVAVEPMTCAPNAFNSGEGLIVLAPGESNTHLLSISELV